MEQYILFSERELLRETALVVILTDGFSGGPPSPESRVIIGDSRFQAIRNLSGFHVFTRTPWGETFEVRVYCDDFFPGSLTLTPEDIAKLDPKNPVVKMTLEPLPSYPFPGGTTLVRGMVKNSAGRPIAGARLETVGKYPGTQTTQKGEFALFFTGITEDDILIEQTKKMLAFDGKTELTIKVEKDTKTMTYTVPSIPEGETTVLPGPLLLD